MSHRIYIFFFFQAEDGIRDVAVTGVQTCALPIYLPTLLRPQKAYSGGPAGGHPRASLADFTNSAERTITHRLSLSHSVTFGLRAARSAVQWSMRCIASLGSNGRSDGDWPPWQTMQVCGPGSSRPNSRERSLSRITTADWYQRPPPWQVSQETPCTSACPARCSSREWHCKQSGFWR